MCASRLKSDPQLTFSSVSYASVAKESVMIEYMTFWLAKLFTEFLIGVVVLILVGVVVAVAK